MITLLYGLAVRALLELVDLAHELERRATETRQALGRLVRG